MTAAQIAIYGLVLWAGVSAFREPPSLIEWKFGAVQTYTWAIMGIVGGGLGLVSCPRGVWWLEKPAIWACMGSVVVYASMVFSLDQTESGNRQPTLFFVMCVLFHFVTRYARIKHDAYDPEK